MIICFECSQLTKKILDEIMNLGQYENYGQAISAAIENLGILHKEISRKGSLIINSPDDGKQTGMKDVLDGGLKGDLFAKSQRPKAEKIPPSIPELFQNSDLKRPLHFAPLPDDKWGLNDNIPLNKWFFAMYNRLLPAKVNCRALAHLQSDMEDSVPYDQARSAVSGAAKVFGNYLKEIDMRNGHNRDDAFSTAFPVSGERQNQSLERYLNQFLGYVNKGGNIESLLYSLKLINYKRSDNPKIMLTEAGWNFAILENEILDKNGMVTPQKFSDEEIDFLLQHISQNVQIENQAYRLIIQSIIEGKNTPSGLDDALRITVLHEEGVKLTDSYLSSQRSGAISRMSDLGLILRVRSGITIKYQVTERARRYIGTAQKAE